jgi:hypothetical protein
MSCLVNLTGKITVGGDCGCSGGGSGGAPTKQQPLSFACQGVNYPAIVSTDCPQQIQTPGVIGASWVDVPGQGTLANYRLLYVLTKAPMALRIGAAAATLLGSGGTFPTGFVGGETFAFEADGIAVPVVFTSGAQSAAQVVAQINQAAVGAGLTYLPATVDTTGQVRLTGKATGVQGSIEITTANAVVGFAAATTVAGSGSDVRINGLFLAQFDEQAAPTRIQISGQGQVEVLAAGSAVV